MKTKLLFILFLTTILSFGQGGTGEVIVTEIYNRPQKPSDAAELTVWLQSLGYQFGDDEWDGGSETEASPDEGHTEWFEVYNTTQAVVDMTGWVLKDESNNNTHVMGAFTIGPGEYKVFAGMDYSNDIGYSIVDYEYGYKSLSFNNESSYDASSDTSCPDGISIYKADTTTLVDSVEYDYGYNLSSCLDSQDTDHDFPGQGGNSKTSFQLDNNFLVTAEPDNKLYWSYTDSANVYDTDNNQKGTPGFANDTDPSLSVKENLIGSFKIYPNPAQDHIQIDSNSINISSVEMYNIIGKRLISEKNLVENKLDISSLNSGVYLLKINALEGSLVKKIIVE